jgi:2,4-dienoyl-CoA reductase-like NADH-dependent reductase (Old Yellow Enzyme family)
MSTMGPSLSTPTVPLLSTLLTPFRLGPLVLRNKFMMAALTRDRCHPTNVPTDMMVEYYRQRAKGGVSLIVSEGILIERQG